MSTSSVRPVRLSVCQLNSGEDKEANLKICQSFIEQGKSEGSEMIFFPEAFDFICASSQSTRDKAETIDGSLIERFRQWARSYRLWFSLGGFHRKVEGKDKIFNTHLIIDEQGSIVGQYDKIHLFDVESGSMQYKESDSVDFGQRICFPVSTPVGRVGLSICYDLRFPEQSRLLTFAHELGAQILTYPSAFTKQTGEDHWHILLRARAIENQCFVVAAAQVGVHGSSKRQSYGHSMVIDPWGKVLLEIKDDRVAIETISIDLSSIDRVRQKMPIVEHRRRDLYKLFSFDVESRPWEKDREATFRWGQVEIDERQVFYRSKFSFGMVNRKPVVRGHVLVSPVRRVQRFNELSEEELFDLFVSCQRVGAKIESIYQGQSLTLAIQDGPQAGQTIEHVHVHLLPRRDGDFKTNDSVYQELANHDKRPTDFRTIEQMAEEANSLREKFY